MAAWARALSLHVAAGTLAGLLAPCASRSFLEAPRAGRGDAEASLAAELAGRVDGSRLLALEGALRVTYGSLPKNAHGNLGHRAVRYVLHRLFVQRHGWYIKGLEPETDAQSVPPSNTSLTEWVPSYLQERLEQREGGRGTDLHELAALAATLEDLVRKEATAKLQIAYEIHELPVDEAISREQLDKVIGTYYVNFLVANKFAATGPTNAEAKKTIFASKYKDWSAAEEWLEEAMGSVRAPGVDGRFDFSVATRMALRIGEEYHKFNDLECKSLKHTLQQIEGKKPGRVRLSAFYNKGLYSHWRFNEKAEYLRTLGALDESNASQAQVILPNYLMARTNCLEASDFYALCCQNECEDLMGRLEHAIGAPEAGVARIAQLVAELPSGTVAAPRELSAVLLGRLGQVAERNAGAVPLHGRLFAQWMHHAFPRECPYPHEAGTTLPQTPDEWMQGTGHASTAASKEEMVRQVESDTCMSAGGDEGEGSADLPWSEAEELLHARPPPAAAEPDAVRARTGSPGGGGIFTFFLVATAVALALVVALDCRCTSQRQHGLLGSNPAVATGLRGAGLNVRAVLLCISLGFAACTLDLLDTTVFLLALCAGLCALALRLRSAPKAPQHKEGKCLV